ncbi:MAG: ATP-binding protein [Syntrophales bacterium]|jgi:signal transduction histidine kinase
MFSLRQKLFLGFGGLLLIIALTGIQSISKVTELGDAIDVILRENYQSVLACQNMKESLERMDSGAQFILTGYGGEGRKAIRNNLPEFEKALVIELNNITVPGEGEKAAHLQELFARYKTMIQHMEGKAMARERQRDMYFNQLFPLFREIKGTADDILNMNQKNMYDANQSARHKAAKAREQMYFLLILGAVLAVAYIFLVGKWILRPIERLTQSAEEIKQGNLDLIVKTDTRDEIGRLSEAFNAMAASLREVRRSDEAKLVRIQHSTQQTFDNLPDAVAILDLEGKVEMATETARNIFGLKRNIRIESVPLKWITDLYRDALKGDHTSSKETATAVVQHFVDAEEHFFRPMTAPILNNRRELIGIILILKDVTDQLEQDELKKGVISTVSHQLKTPLTSIRMAIHLLLDEKVGPLTLKQQELLIAAQEDSERLHKILVNLLDISRIVSGKMAMELHAVPPHQIISETVESFRGAALGHGVKIHTLLPGDLPEVRADKMRIGHVFANLLSNALRYTASGDTVTVTAQVGEEQVEFSVSDTGRGIPEQYLSRIFDPFFRVPGQETDTGTGLGLSIVKEIVEAHGGSVSVKSIVGEGTTISFTLPKYTGEANSHKNDEKKL